jgi:xanthine/uracil permease
MSTKCASRFTLLPATAIMVILSLFPAATGFVANVPTVVIGAVLAYVLTSQIAAGLFVAFRDAEEGGFRFENGLIIGLSILLGTMIAFFPDKILSTLPSFLRPVLGNGFVVGVVTALFLDHVILRR